MVTILELVFRSPWTFAGSVVLLLAVGVVVGEFRPIYIVRTVKENADMKHLNLLFLALVAASSTACFVDGKELLAPEDPRYAEMCADSVVTYEDYVCRQEGDVSITIPNPLCGVSVICEPADTVPAPAYEQ